MFQWKLDHLNDLVDWKRYFKPNHDVFLTLSKCFLCINLTRDRRQFNLEKTPVFTWCRWCRLHEFSRDWIRHISLFESTSDGLTGPLWLTFWNWFSLVRLRHETALFKMIIVWVQISMFVKKHEFRTWEKYTTQFKINQPWPLVLTLNPHTAISWVKTLMWTCEPSCSLYYIARVPPLLSGSLPMATGSHNLTLNINICCNKLLAQVRYTHHVSCGDELEGK